MIYYTSAVMAAILGGVLVAVMLLLYAAVRDVITVVGPGDGSPLYADQEDAETSTEVAEPKAKAEAAKREKRSEATGA